MNQTTIFILLVFTLAVTPKATIAEPIVELKTDYYLISGETAAEIRDSMDRKRPIRENGLSYDAHTDWFVKWNFWWGQPNDSCTITRVTTKLNIQFILPELNGTSTLAEALRHKWKIYMEALLRHEDGHRNISIRAANEIENKILNMASRPTCERLEIDANQIGNSLLRKFRAIEEEYDRNSNHGMNDGAVFP